MTINKNFILNTDSYKASHFEQYPDGTKYVYSYIESRGGKFDKTLFFGLQAFIKEYLQTPITMMDIDQAEKFWKAHGEPFNRPGWEIIVNEYGGLLPVKIWAVPEGTMVPVSNALVSVVNTDERLGWVTSYLETALLRAIWYPTTVATQSKYIKNLILRYLEETGNPDLINFKLHDFGARGVSSFESAALGGMAHLINFMGTDTVSGILAAQEYYNTEEMVAFSIPAAEHSTMTILGREGEVTQMKRMLDKFAKEGSLFAVVSDSYDIYNACRIWGTELKDQLIESGATLVVRPDSGDPATVVLKVVQELDVWFGSTMNGKGYKVLNPAVRVIQGDGINLESIQSILFTLKMAGYAADNIAFGMGGALLQQINRDTQKFAMKASAANINGIWVDVYKDPITDSGKRSKKGLIESYVSKMTGEWITAVNANDSEWTPMMEEVFFNGKLEKEFNFQQVRDNSNK